MTNRIGWNSAGAPLLAAALLTGLVGPVVPAAAKQPDLIPREVFFGNPERAGVQLSPDGDRISFLAPLEGVLNVWVQTLGQDDARAITDATERPIRSYFWAWNGDQIVYAQDRGGDENFRLYAVDVETGEELELTPFDQIQARVLGGDRDYPDELLIAINNRNPQLHDVYRVNLRTGDRELVYENTDGYVGFLSDSDLHIRVASRMRPDGGVEVFTRDTPDGEWYELVQWSMEDAGSSGPVGISRDGSTIYIQDARQSDTSGLFMYDLHGGADGEPVYEQVAIDNRADVSNIVMDPETGRPQAVGFEYARMEWQFLDPELRADWKNLQSISRGEVSIVDRDRDDDTWLVAFRRDDGPVDYYLYERGGEKPSHEYLFCSRPALKDLPLAQMEPVIIEARDGLKLVSYLTTPVGMKAKDLPMVLLVHGGPWARDSWGYDGLHQWLSNRGYAVLSVNFRGSTGFGKRFMNAGNREWAGKMHDDLIDAVNWAVEEGVADPDRVAIMGGSYGGYATLVGLTFTPEFFAAGVDIVGPSHVRTLLESIPPYWRPIQSMFESRVGGLDEPEFLDQISPLTRVDQIERPLLIGQGANDPRVKEAESQQIVDAMQAKGLPVTYIVFPDEGHGFAHPENSMAFFAVTEAFLSEHIGGRYEPIGSSVRVSTAQVKAGADLVPGLADSGGQSGGEGETEAAGEEG